MTYGSYNDSLTLAQALPHFPPSLFSPHLNVTNTFLLTFHGRLKKKKIFLLIAFLNANMAEEGGGKRVTLGLDSRSTAFLCATLKAVSPF